MAAIALMHNGQKNGAAAQFALSIASRLSFRPLTYGYANARVHGMFASLLSSAQIEEMISSRSVSSLAELLERTPYKKDLVELSLNFKGEELIELALSRNFANYSRQVLKFTPPTARPIIDAILSRWDAHNLKTIILARKQGKSYESIAPYLVLAATLTKAQLKCLLSAQSAEEFYAKLRLTKFGAGLMSIPASASNGGSIRQMLLSMGRDDTALEPLLGILDFYSY
ncbi:MAG: V-type ATPase subunit, partial [Candidatus Micrarchaeota archaeon]